MIFVHNIDPILLTLGPLELRWYGLLFALGILCYYAVTRWIFKREKKSLEDMDSLILYLFFGLLIGARMGHVIFYNWAYFSEHLLEILRIWNGGLSSHGATIGLFVALIVWKYVHKEKLVKYVDLLVIAMPLVAGFVRVGNFFNSEILGIKTDGTWGVVFSKLGEDFPRHPSQIYEAFLSFFIFFVLILVYKKFYKKLPKFFLTFLYVDLYFVSRFLVEFFKDMHVLPSDFPLSMGQILSILPIVLASIYFALIPLLSKKFPSFKQN